MSDGGGANSELFRLWLEGARAFAGAGGPASGALWQRAEGLFSAWGRYAEAFAGADQARQSARGASPFDPAGWLRSPGQGGMADLWRWLEGPDIGALVAEERAAIRETREWAAFAAAEEQLRAVVAEGWMRAFRDFVRTLGARYAETCGAGAPEPDLAAITALWREVADEEMARTHRSERFLAAQRDLIEAQLAVRATLRARIERFAEALGLPTRAELDDLHATVDQLRRELRARKRGQRENRPGD